jgi:hypothetical protein
MKRPASLAKVVAVSLAVGIGVKLLLLGGATLLFGFAQARPLLFPGTGLLLAALVFPLVRRRMAAR